MRSLVLAALLLAPPAPAGAQAAVHLELAGARVGQDQPTYPRLKQVPSSPAYYDPLGTVNLFFYDGRFWVFQGEAWFAGAWFSGPWTPVARADVPLHLLRIPVWFYRQPPAAFRTSRPDSAPRWGELWGAAWERQNRGWDAWSPGGVPAPAPLPAYQQAYAGDRYPAAEHQAALQREHYPYQPRDAALREALLAPHRAAAAPRATPKRRVQRPGAGDATWGAPAQKLGMR